MTQMEDFSASSSEAITAALGQRLDEIRLARNINQADLARAAGVSRSTLTRIAEGRGVSLDSFVRVVKALGLVDHLATLLPDPGVRPVELAANRGKPRRRARGKQKPATPWTWGEDDTPA